MELQLLTSEELVKGLCAISVNINGKLISQSIMEAQEIDYRMIVGSPLLAKLKDLESEGELSGKYEECVQLSQFFLGYKAITYLLPKVSYKISEAGAMRTTGENVQPLSRADIAAEVERYNSLSDYQCNLIQKWLLDNISSIPELTQSDYTRINANLYSAATCGIWLGGARGR